MSRRAALSCMILALAAACEGRPRALIICHNSNCAAPTDPSIDDTIQALRLSLQLMWNGEPLVDGMEVDSVWDTERKKCYFAHGFDSAIGAVEDNEAIAEITQHLRETAALVGGRRYYVKIELKALTAPEGKPHTSRDLSQHAECVLQMYEDLALAARESGRKLTVFFEAEFPDVVFPVTRSEHYPGKNPGQQIQTGIIVPIGVTPPNGLDVDVVAVSWQNVHDGDYGEYQDLKDRGIDVMLWMFDAGIETLGTIDYVRPKFINTNEATLIREWLGPRIEE